VPGSRNTLDRFLLPPRLVRHGFAWLEALSRGLHVHAGPEAHALARGADARALTVGRDIYVREGRFEPSSPRGLALLAHELVHVWQHARAGGPLVHGEHARQETVLEGQARAVEFSVLALMQTPSDDRADDRPSPDAPPALYLARPARSADAGAHEASFGSTRGPIAGALALRAPEARPAEPAAPAEASAADPAELAGQVLRLIERRLRVDRERLGIGAA
jgi:hypothetical protein